jgi:hypothetical protein
MPTENEENTVSGKLSWSPSIDAILIRWCDEAKCFEWMHTESFSFYDQRARAIMVTSNILTALSGLSNVIAGGTTINGFQLAWIFGSLSIIVSMANMLQDKLAYNVRAANHKIYSVQWGTIRRYIDEILSIPIANRIDCDICMKYLRKDINKASVDGNIKIPDFIRDECYEKFNKIPDFNIPDICGQIEHTQAYNNTIIHMSTLENSDMLEKLIPPLR